MPKKMPMEAEKPRPSANDHQGSDTGKPDTRFTSKPMALPISTPSKPPTLVSTAASMRNCTRISRRRAPMALRTPISRVRSVTEIVMMAITPIPPTMRAIDEITTSDSRMAAEIWSQTARMASAVTRSKSLG